MKLLVADSGPLIALACSGHLEVLRVIVSEVLIPETVYIECTANTDLPGAESISKAVSAGKLQRIPDPPLDVFENMPDIDPGEAAVLALAKERGAVVLMDDAMGREIAKAHGIPMVGACGILLKAKHLGLIAEVGSILQTWKSTIGYHLSEALVSEVMRRAGE